MATEEQTRLQIGHVLFIDVVGYSKLLVNQQSEILRELNEVVSRTSQFRESEAQQKLIRLPTGDGMALVFRDSPEAPAQCAVEIARGLKEHPRVALRMGIHSGPVNEVADVNQRQNIAGAGINMAQRVMDCGDAGHILVSKHVADDLEQHDRWRPLLHELGTCAVKHGVRIDISNLYSDEVGNPQLPKKFQALKKHRSHVRWAEAAIALFVLAAVVAAFFFVLRRPIRSALTVAEKSIAVLPFENLSEEKQNEYFAEGIQDEILTRLSKIAALKVISRTSTQRYKSAPQNLEEIGKQLGVANLLEGSVQKISNAVHINVQLIRVATDEHLWAESYNRKLDDVFGVEGEVANAIADQLKAKLTGAELQAITDKPTQNPAAYDAYLRGLSIEHNQYGLSAAKKAAEACAEAVQIDSSFALAWASLAIVRSRLYLYGIDAGANSAAATREAADKAMALQPELAEAWAAQGAYRYRVARDFSGALEAYEEANKRFPNNSHILVEMAVVETRLGHWDKAEGHWRKAMDLDPRNSGLLTTVALEFVSRLRRFSEAHDLLDRVFQISPDDQFIHAANARLLQDEGRLDEAAKELASFPADSIADEVVAARAELLIWKRQFDAAIAVLQRKLNSVTPGEPLDEWNKIHIIQMGYCQERTGRPEEAKATFIRALHEIKPSSDAVVSPRGFGMPVYLAQVYAGLGEKEKALEQAHLAVEEYADDGWVKPFAEQTLAEIQARFGDIDSAIAAIPHLLVVPGGITRADLRFNPSWDSLRKDPRFAKFLSEPQSK